MALDVLLGVLVHRGDLGLESGRVVTWLELGLGLGVGVRMRARVRRTRVRLR